MERDVYRLTADIDDPEMGPAISSGTLVYLNEWIGDWASVTPVDGTGETTFVLAASLEFIDDDE